jgi:NADP-reducing hydrogenase subunit HndB
MADKITSPDQLRALAEKAKADIDLREGRKETQVTVHMGTCGIAAGAREIVAAFMTELSANGVSSASSSSGVTPPWWQTCVTRG